MWRVYLTTMEPLHLELSLYRTIEYSRIPPYSESSIEWVENTIP
jgi:hypothetical protein